MRRRELLLATGALLAAPLAGAQPVARVYRVGVVSSGLPGPSIDAFRQGLRELGYVEGKNLVVEERVSDSRSDRFPELALGVRRNLPVVDREPRCSKPFL